MTNLDMQNLNRETMKHQNGLCAVMISLLLIKALRPIIFGVILHERFLLRRERLSRI